MALYEEKESYAASRSGGIGGTDAAAILGLSPWKRPIDVYAAKIEPEAQPELDKEILWWGSALEPIVRGRYAQRFAVDVVSPADLSRPFPRSRPWMDTTLIIGDEPWMLGAPDGWIPSVTSGLEVKCAGRKSDEWGPEGTDEVPAHYLVQAAWYMAVCKAKGWNFAVLFSGNTLAQYRVVHDPQLERDMIEACRSFWFDYVQQGVEPPIDESENYGKYLARKFSLSTGAVLTHPSAEFIEAAESLKTAQAAVKSAEEETQFQKNRLAALLANADAAVTPFGKVGWVRPGPRSTTDWKGLAAQQAIPQDVIDAFTKPSPVSAYVRGWWKK